MTPISLLKMVPIAGQSLTAIKTCKKCNLGHKNMCLWHLVSRDVVMRHDFDHDWPRDPKIMKMWHFVNFLQNHEKHEFYWFLPFSWCCVEPLKLMWNYILFNCWQQHFDRFKCRQWGINVWHWQMLDVINAKITYFYVSHGCQVLEITKMHELWHII